MAAHSDAPSPARHLVHDGKDVLVMVGLALFTGAGVGTWLWGALAAWLTHGRVPHLTVSQSTSIIVRLPEHLNDPRTAWPDSVRSSLPGPLPFYGSGLLLLVLLSGCLWAGCRLWSRFKRRDDGFATRKDLAVHLTESAILRRGIIVRPSLRESAFGLTDVGLPLGCSLPDKLRLAVSTEDSVLVIAAPRQGKSSQVVIPWMHRWPGPALVTSAPVKSSKTMASFD